MKKTALQFDKVIGARIERLIRQKGYSVRQWAAVIERLPATCEAIINAAQTITPYEAMLTASWLGVSLQELLNRVGDLPVHMRSKSERGQEAMIELLMAELQDYFRFKEAEKTQLQP